MTFRSIIVGLLSACVVCMATIINNHVIHQTHLVGNQIPIVVYGILILFIVLINPVLWRVRRASAFTGKELAVVAALTLVTCSIPQSGLLRYLTPVLMLPHHYQNTEPGWSGQGVVEMVPERMLPKVTEENKDEALGGFLKGLVRPSDQEHIRFMDVPWRAWAGTLMFWGPLILALWIGLIGLSLVVHRQWSDHEQLAYPIAEFANSLLPDKDQCVGGVIRNRLFWVGAIIVLGIHTINYLHAWFPDNMILVHRSFDLTGIADLFPTFKRGWEQPLLRPTIYFTVVGFAYFLATDVSLSLSLGPFVYCYLTGWFLRHGIALQAGGYMHLQPLTFFQFGGFMAMFIGLVVMGRHFYGRVFRSALFFPVHHVPDRSAIWGARIFLGGLIVFISLLWGVGLDWQLATLYGILTVVLFVVLSRVVAETGFFHLQAWWFPCVVLMGFFGPFALHPTTYIIMILVSVVIAHDPRETLMPFVVNFLKLLDMRGVKIGPAASWCVGSLVLAMLVSVMLTLYVEYDRGTNHADIWAIQVASKLAFREVIHFSQHLAAQGSMEQAREITGWRRFAHMAPDGSYMIWFGVGMALVAAFTFLRVRFARWPLHPVFFITWCTYPGFVMAVSFLIGWLIKATVSKYGGAARYQALKPLMIGVIAGDLIGSFGAFLVGTLLHLILGLPIRYFSTMPG